MKETNISKSSFMRGRQCHKALWLHKHRPELAPREPVSRNARKDEGTAVGKLACGLFPGGHEVPTDDWDNKDFNELLNLTEKYIAGSMFRRILFLTLPGAAKGKDLVCTKKESWPLPTCPVILH